LWGIPLVHLDPSVKCCCVALLHEKVQKGMSWMECTAVTSQLFREAELKQKLSNVDVGLEKWATE